MPPIYLLVVLFVGGYVWVCTLVATRAKRKGRSWGLWLFFALFVSPLWSAMLVSSMAPSADAAMAAGQVTCPRCAERIQRAAKMCRFCGLDLADVDFSSPPPTAADIDALSRQVIDGRLYETDASIIADIDATLADGVPTKQIRSYWTGLHAAGQVTDRELATALAHLDIAVAPHAR